MKKSNFFLWIFSEKFFYSAEPRTTQSHANIFYIRTIQNNLQHLAQRSRTRIYSWKNQDFSQSRNSHNAVAREYIPEQEKADGTINCSHNAVAREYILRQKINKVN